MIVQWRRSMNPRLGALRSFCFFDVFVFAWLAARLRARTVKLLDARLRQQTNAISRRTRATLARARTHLHGLVGGALLQFTAVVVVVDCCLRLFVVVVVERASANDAQRSPLARQEY